MQEGSVKIRSLTAKLVEPLAPAIRGYAETFSGKAVASVVTAGHFALLEQPRPVRDRLVKRVEAEKNDPDGMARLMAQAESGVLLDRIRREIAEEHELEVGTGPTQLIERTDTPTVPEPIINRRNEKAPSKRGAKKGT
ncbi:MAG: hypothetical protein AAGD32_17385 [Planctomycetota bacterium]